MTTKRILNFALAAYLAVFFFYLFAPLIFMVIAAFNDSRFPTAFPWHGFTLDWFYGYDSRGRPIGLFQDTRLAQAIWNSVLIGFGVIALSVPIGLAGALFIASFRGRSKSLIYGIMISPILTPGVILGISTLIFWQDRFGVGGGLFLTVIAQTTFIAAYCMLLFLARLERFDFTLQEAALDLGASHTYVVWRILLPYMWPAILSAALIAFLQSFENYNTTLFVIGIQETMTLNIANRVRLGLTPAINAIGVILIAFTVAGAVLYEVFRRREEAARRAAAKRRQAAIAKEAETLHLAPS
ncbi:MAG: ABC transporter permease [Geminicoccaceae bacterium]|nr:MAG: ABC transporter permease [Geminicoccaceae bacterium]